MLRQVPIGKIVWGGKKRFKPFLLHYITLESITSFDILEYRAFALRTLQFYIKYFAQHRALADWLLWWRRSMICRTINDLSDCLREKKLLRRLSLSAGFIYQRDDDYSLIPGPFLKCEGGQSPWHRLASSFISLVYYLTQLICSEPYIRIHVFVQ